MGVNIIAYRLLRQESDDPPYDWYKYWITEPYNKFDSLRYGGDRDFAGCSGFKWKEVYDGEGRYNDRHYSRPENVDDAIDWIKKSIPEGNQKRLIDLMEDMRKDESIYIFCSW